MSANRSLILRENKLAFWTYKRHDNKSQHLFIRAVPSKENIAAVINGYEKSIDIVIQTGSWCYNNTIYDSARQLLENRSGLDNPQKCSLKKLAAETRKNHCLLPVYGPAGATGCILISKHEITRRCGNGVDWKIAGKKILEDCSKKSLRCHKKRPLRPLPLRKSLQHKPGHRYKSGRRRSSGNPWSVYRHQLCRKRCSEPAR